mmetsp:Transcript_25589/g.53056  ORF Transcript_25589/g.53056 Transcript_25589/m.53056 type:complete len:306 (+) Transcript_25589:2-919(+)
MVALARRSVARLLAVDGRARAWALPQSLPRAVLPGWSPARHGSGSCSEPAGPSGLHGGQGKYSKASAAAYAGIDLSEGTFWLMYRHAEAAIGKWLPAPPSEARALDWGCGSGKSARWLRSALSLAEVHGADVDPQMLEQARAADPLGEYAIAAGGCCPFPPGRYDLVLSMCVLIEISSLDAMRAYAREAFRMLRSGGIAVAVSATEESRDPANKFLSFRYLPSDPADPRNQRLRSGDRVLCRNNCGLVMQDFFWTLDDIQTAFEAAGFLTLGVTRTTGAADDPFEWGAELRVASDYVVVFKKPEQ